jgi:hypothetical protein
MNIFELFSHSFSSLRRGRPPVYGCPVSGKRICGEGRAETGENAMTETGKASVGEKAKDYFEGGYN